MASIQKEITGLLTKWSNGDGGALEELIPLVYPELRRIARRYMRREQLHHTLQTSALINEAYLRLIDQRTVDWKNRAHFYAVAAQVMRHILIDHARKYRFAKRGSDATRVPLDDALRQKSEIASEFIALDDALNSLATIDPRKSRVVELRFFGGLTVEETASVLELSPITVKREWRAARAWLHREISGSDPPEK
jgi:RNA polymerase sigma-70 factor, ECF subfamily